MKFKKGSLLIDGVEIGEIKSMEYSVDNNFHKFKGKVISATPKKQTYSFSCEIICAYTLKEKLKRVINKCLESMKI